MLYHSGKAQGNRRNVALGIWSLLDLKDGSVEPRLCCHGNTCQYVRTVLYVRKNGYPVILLRAFT